MSAESPHTLCVVMHDVTPVNWGDCQLVLKALRQVAPVRATLLVIPEYTKGRAARRDADFCALLTEQLAAGDELALHGFRHHDDAPEGGLRERIMRGRFGTAQGEFAALDARAAERRIRAGSKWFAENGWPLEGFIAPAWRMSDATWRMLPGLGLRYTTTRDRLYLLPEGRPVAAPSLTYGARGRWLRLVCGGWLDLKARGKVQRSIIRLGLHPLDAHYPSVLAHWQRLLERLLRTHTVRTKAELGALARGMPAPVRDSS